MGLAHSPRIVTNNLLLNVDASNIKSYDGSENYFLYSEDFSNAVWTKGNISQALDNTINPPVNGMSVYKLTESVDSVAVQHLLYANPITVAIGDIYTLSCYVKAGTRTAVSLTAWGEGYSAFNLSTGTIIQTGGNITNIVSVGDGWYRIFATITKTNTQPWFYLIHWNNTNSYIGNGSNYYATGMQVERGYGLNSYVKTTTSSDYKSTILYDTIGNRQFNITNNTWLSFANSSLTFTRPANTSPNPKIGGILDVTTTGSLAASNFLYNDHTWEVWVKIDDITPGQYDATEGYSGISAYRGYHGGFMYTSGGLYYYIWDSVGPTNKQAATWTLGTSGTHIVQNNWTQIAITRSGNVFTPYVNGVQLGTGSTITTNTFSGTANTLCIGGINYSTTPGSSSYCYYPKNTFSNMRMYNRALSAQEIKQNFNALRGRFGI